MAKKATDPRSRDAAQRVLQFDFTRELFERNHRELRLLLEHLQNPRVALAIAGDEGRWVRHEAMEEVGFRLHNFVAAAQSLVDHARVTYRHLYEPEGLMAGYQQEIQARFVTDPLSQFVIGLRQMVQHYRLPNIRFSQSFTNAPGNGSLKVRLLLDVDDLLTFESWNASAKAFLASAGKDVAISEVTEAYYNHVIAFYTWFDMRQQEIHGQGPALYSRLTRHGLNSPEAAIVASIVANVDSLVKQRRAELTYDALLAAIAPGLTLMDQQALLLCQHDVVAWIHEAFRTVSKRFAVPQSVRTELLAFVTPEPDRTDSN